MFEVTPFVVGMAFVALQGAQVIGRFTGDALTNRIGARGVVTQGLVIALVGTAAAVAFPSAAMTLVGFACAGWASPRPSRSRCTPRTNCPAWPTATA
ncbi:MFS transporter [Tessaracoccus sp. HDW20]|uniref:hypothetical protein n=1 Tax=Tessaracoccus coleopterorum TaxID=2714950 RepID=UPI0018D3568A|nr:hypothetical protein [Tessaracoccus coleopterorum]NHB85405.1 MFS transporter [Tessaracoccus coleopterorum]